ncbi:MAG: transposase [Labilithrix sp.]|nr:transposase [Labilithrix sp.]
MPQLDIDWSDSKQKATAVAIVERQVSALHRWVEAHLDDTDLTPLTPYIEAISQVRAQNLETENGTSRIRQGVAPDRRISIEDGEMRHGRKSKRFDGYKEHIARDLDLPLVLACAVTRANHPEEEPAAPIASDIQGQGLTLAELHIDRAYVNSPIVDATVKAGGRVLAKPWPIPPRPSGLFTKLDFKIDARSRTITCPAGQVEPFTPGKTVEFDPDVCGGCQHRSRCTNSASGKGRSVSMAVDEARQKTFRRLQQTPSGRARLRERVQVEHASLTSLRGRGRAPATSACAAICSTCAARPRSRISRTRSGSRWRRDPRQRRRFNPGCRSSAAASLREGLDETVIGRRSVNEGRVHADEDE